MLHEADLTKEIIGAAIEVHRELGPGLLESAYQACLAHELRLRKLDFEQEKPLLVRYKDEWIDCAYRLDFVIANKVIVETKSVDVLIPIHEAQILSYMKLSGHRIGLLINFNVTILKNGIRRFAL